jgi:hypothetical protein
MTTFQDENNTERWWFNTTSGLYFLSAENDPVEEYRGVLVKGNFTSSNQVRVRDGVPFEPGLERGVYLSCRTQQEGWQIHEIVLFDPANNTYQISNLGWRDTKESIEFQPLDDSVASHIFYHRGRFYTAPNTEKNELDQLFKILGERETEKRRRQFNRLNYILELAGKK